MESPYRSLQKKSVTCIFFYQFIIIIIIILIKGKNTLSGTRLQEFRNQDPSENVVAEHEDQADCVGNFDSTDPHNSPFCLPRIQLWWKISTQSESCFMLLC